MSYAVIASAAAHPDRQQCCRTLDPTDRAQSQANALFVGSAGSGEHCAVIASLIETCKLFFEGAPSHPTQAGGTREAASLAYVSEFLATSDGLALTQAFVKIKNKKLKRRIVDLVEAIADHNRI